MVPARPDDIGRSGGERMPTINTMYTVYVLRDCDGKLYKGLTNNLSRRIKEHHFGKTITTSRMNDLKLVYKEEYELFEEARKRELYLKSAAGRRFLRKKLNVDGDR